MRIQDIEIGKTYRLKSSPNYGYVKVIAIYRKMPMYKRRVHWIPENVPNKTCVKVEHTVLKDDNKGLCIIRYFLPSDLILDTSK